MKHTLFLIVKSVMIAMGALVSVFIVFGWLAGKQEPMSDAEFERQLKQLKKEQRIRNRARHIEEEYWVTYQVSGTTSSAKVTYTNSTGGTQQETTSLPWTLDCLVSGPYHAYILAQNAEKDGTISVRILVNNQEKKSSQSSGAYVIAAASLMYVPPE